MELMMNIADMNIPMMINIADTGYSNDELLT